MDTTNSDLSPADTLNAPRTPNYQRLGRGYLALVTAALLLVSITIAPVLAQSMMTSPPSGTPTPNNDIQKGQDVYTKLQNKQVTCHQLSDDDFDVLGDFYMSRMMGNANQDTMDQYMDQRFGSVTNRQMHITLAKRLSGCNPNAAYPTTVNNYGAWPMMANGMMGVGWPGWNMMGGYYSPWSWVGLLLFWMIFIIAIAVGLIWWLRKSRTPASPLGVLKLRYAKGEINGEEYDRLVKDLK